MRHSDLILFVKNNELSQVAMNGRAMLPRQRHCQRGLPPTFRKMSHWDSAPNSTPVEAMLL